MEVPLGAQLCEQLMRAIEILYSFAKAALMREHLRALSRDLGLEQHILPRSGNEVGAVEVPFGDFGMTRLARDHSKLLEQLGLSAFIANIPRATQRSRADGPRAYVVLLGDGQLGEIHVDEHASHDISYRGRRGNRLVERTLGVGPLSEVGMNHSDVVQHPTQLRDVSQSPVRHETRSVVAEKIGRASCRER